VPKGQRVFARLESSPQVDTIPYLQIFFFKTYSKLHIDVGDISIINPSLARMNFSYFRCMFSSAYGHVHHLPPWNCCLSINSSIHAGSSRYVNTNALVNSPSNTYSSPLPSSVIIVNGRACWCLFFVILKASSLVMPFMRRDFILPFLVFGMQCPSLDESLPLPNASTCLSPHVPRHCNLILYLNACFDIPQLCLAITYKPEFIRL
jgi:hypothetical protein